ncbi:hypothetical protein PQX77_012923 [Marasmius sp. AFHP31]|nr:hypothetical protein PQX77_012923 [Marasmius sp. AFHP31]
MRLVVRYRTRRIWLDDAWAFVALVCSFMLLVGMWIRTDLPGRGPLNQPRSTRVVAYWYVRFRHLSDIYREYDLTYPGQDGGRELHEHSLGREDEHHILRHSTDTSNDEIAADIQLFRSAIHADVDRSTDPEDLHLRLE